VTDDAGPEWLPAREVAKILGVERTTVHRIPRSELPYRESPGSERRRGRRTYHRDDVERVRLDRSGQGRSLEDQIAELRRQVAAAAESADETRGRVDSVEERLDRLERGEP